jgi:nicotinate-nucleotide adenylyltransferase
MSHPAEAQAGRPPAPPFGILGGTFDPVHLGHLGIANAARDALGLATIQIAPARVPPHRTGPMVSIYHRFAMVALAAGTGAGLIACDLGLDSTEPSYTGTLLDLFAGAGHTASQMVFIIGADAFADIATWRYYPAILDRCHFAVVSRPGLSVAALPDRLPALATRFTTVAPAGPPPSPWPAEPRLFLIDAPTPDVSSTAIRARARAGQPLDGLVPASVAHYVRRQGLYTA